jgi:hypothetical protein
MYADVLHKLCWLHNGQWRGGTQWTSAFLTNSAMGGTFVFTDEAGIIYGEPGIFSREILVDNDNANRYEFDMGK